MSRIIYLDNHATTPVDRQVFESMIPYLTDQFGNPESSTHPYGWAASEACEKGRTQVASLIGATPKEIIFTSGATESNNLAIQGVVSFYEDKGDHIITSSIEHKSVLDTCKELEKRGKKVTYLPVDKFGFVNMEDLRKAITSKTVIITIMSANNEIGTIQPVLEIGKIAHDCGIIFHTDAAQAVGKILFDVNKINADIVSLSSHKIYGPKGIGAIYIRIRNPKVRLKPLFFGGGQEHGIRPGTLNVPGIAGFGMAAKLCCELLSDEAQRILYLRERLKSGIMSQLDYVYVNGPGENRLPGNLNLSFAYIEGESLIMGLKGIAVSSGSACSAKDLSTSHVLKSIGVDDTLAHSSIRFGIGRFNTEEEIDYVINEVVKNVKKFREISPLYKAIKKGETIDASMYTSD